MLNFFFLIQSYGIKGNIINWIIDLLAHRKQRVRINNICSNWQEVISGIPQGSVIGPLLFVIFINDLPDVIKDSHIFLFADDMKHLTIFIMKRTATTYKKISPQSKNGQKHHY